MKDGKKFSYEATADFGRVEIYDEELKKFVKKQDKRRKTFKTLAEARKWLNQIELQKAEAKEKKSFTKMRAFVWLMWLMNFWN